MFLTAYYNSVILFLTEITLFCKYINSGAMIKEQVICCFPVSLNYSKCLQKSVLLLCSDMQTITAT